MSARLLAIALLTAFIAPPAFSGSLDATTKDGRVVSGSLAQESSAAVTVRTTDGTVTLERSQIKSLERMNTSMMPPGLLDDLPPDHIRDLFAYLMSDAGEKTARK